jgi:uncharacterized delta-60 repeat protein
MANIHVCRKAYLMFYVLHLCSLCYAQVTEQWVKRHEGAPYIGTGSKLVVDTYGNIYITGYISTTDNADYLTIKYDAIGNELWAKSYNSVFNRGDVASVLTVDVQGNVYVTGYSENNENSPDYVTIKYDTNGNELWAKRYDGQGNNAEFATAIECDPSGNVYVTGYSYSITSTGYYHYDYATIKYDTHGNELWVKRYNSPGNTNDQALALAIDAQGNVYATGFSYDIYSRGHCSTIKYDTNGNELWVKRYIGPHKGDNIARDIAVDANGNVFVIGSSTGSNYYPDYFTIKYDVKGNELWVKRYNSPVNHYDEANSLAVDAQGNIYVTGTSLVSASNVDIVTIKYDTNGNVLWVKRYNGGVGDAARSMVLDQLGNVYITGYSFNSESSNDYVTVKFDKDGNELWAMKYNGSDNGTDITYSLAIDAQGNVYVTGESSGGFATIKYSQTMGTVISSFTLIDPLTDKEIRELKDGDTINLAALTTTKLNIRANITAATTDSVVFSLSGQQSRHHTEYIAPYALFVNDKENYFGSTLQPGDYTLTAIPYSAAGGQSEPGTPLTIHFHVLHQIVNSFTLINADTDQDIGVLKDGDVIDLSTRPAGTKLNIRANTHPAAVGSVVFDINGPVKRKEIQNSAPYALLSDHRGDYFGIMPPVGSYTLTVTPFSAVGGGGQKGVAKTIAFSVVNTAPITRTDSMLNAIAVRGSLQAAPNPSSGRSTISFSVPQSGYTVLELVDQKGTVVERLYAAQTQACRVYTLQFNSKQLKSGVYVLRLVSGKQVQSYKLVLLQ